MLRRPILLFGRDGQLGRELMRGLRSEAPLVAVGRDDVDLEDVEAVGACIRRAAPSVIVNAAAYTAVDRAESEVDRAFAVNARAVEVMASEAARQDVLMVHFSTDYVFGGAATTPYAESDSPAPASVYGASKLAGEEALRASGARHLTFRLGWVYALHGRNFLRTMLRLFRETEEVRVVADQLGSPTWTSAVVGAVNRALDACHSGNGEFDGANDRLGLYHLSSGDHGSWFEFASAIRELFPSGSVVQRITPITTAEFPTAAIRPAYSVLSPEKFAAAFGLRLPPWREQLARAATVSSAP
jgi:dTDP-4-dehydrorhamnose reductase